MKSYGNLLVIAMAGISVAGCMTPQGQPDNTASGALGGAAVGAIIGSAARHPGPGALAGAAIGAVGGGLIGHSMDQQQQYIQAQSRQMSQYVEPVQPMSVADVKSLAKAGMSDDLIISQIRNSRTVYHLGVAEIIDLKNFGVNEKVIDFMINTPSSAAAYVASTATVPVVETVTVAPYPYYHGWWPWYWGPWGWYGGYGGGWDRGGGHWHGGWGGHHGR